MSVPLRFCSVLVMALLQVACSHKTAAPSPGPVVYRQVAPAVSPLANDVLFRALGLVGTPYVWGGNTPESGFDCSGLIVYVYRDVAGIRLPRTTLEMSRLLAAAPQTLQAGDLVFFATGNAGRVSHAGIYVGEGRFVHAPSAGGTVRLDHLADHYWQKNYLTARRVLKNARLAQNP